MSLSGWYLARVVRLRLDTYDACPYCYRGGCRVIAVGTSYCKACGVNVGCVFVDIVVIIVLRIHLYLREVFLL